MKPRNPPRRTNSTQPTSSQTAPRVLYKGRPEQPVVVRGSSGSLPWTIIGIIIVLVVAGAMGSSKMLGGTFSSSSSSYAQTYEIRNVELKSEGVFKGRVRWTITARVMNSTSEKVNGPRLRVRLLRADNTVAAQGEVDYSRRELAELSGVSLSYQLETTAAETVQAEVTVISP